MPNTNKAKRAAAKIYNSGFRDKDTNTLFISNPAISFDALKGLAKRHGFTIGQTRTGEYVSIPTAQKFKFDGQFASLYDSFMDTYTYYDKNWGTLLSAYKTFDLMDENLAEVGLILDTYTAEVLQQGFVNNSLNIKIENAAAQSIVEKVLYKNKIYQRLTNIVYSLAKYGNYGMAISYPYLEKWLQENPDTLDINQIDIVEDMVIKFINPKNFKVNIDEYDNVVNYETLDDVNACGLKTSTVVSKRIWQPWQFVHFLIPSETTTPYGKSMLWSMRSAFDQLTTLEALLGISRASNIQRLVFYVPLPNTVDLVDAYGFVNEFKSNYLNSIFTDAPGVKTGRKIPGATSILTLPVSHDGKKVEVQSIEAKIDLSSTADVDYFKDKILMNSKLPKGYLVGDDVITTVQTLEAQDLKLKRTLIPLKKALVDGIMNLVENIMTHAGFDVSKIPVSVSITESIQVTADEISKCSDIVDLLKSVQEVNPEMQTVNKFQFLVKMGMPVDLARLICSNSSVNVMNNGNDIGKLLKNQRLKPDLKTIGADDENEFGESKHKLTSDRYLKENLVYAKKLHEFLTANKSNLDRNLQEKVLIPEKRPLTEESDVEWDKAR